MLRKGQWVKIADGAKGILVDIRGADAVVHPVDERGETLMRFNEDRKRYETIEVVLPLHSVTQITSVDEIPPERVATAVDGWRPGAPPPIVRPSAATQFLQRAEELSPEDRQKVIDALLEKQKAQQPPTAQG